MKTIFDPTFEQKDLFNLRWFGAFILRKKNSQSGECQAGAGLFQDYPFNFLYLARCKKGCLMPLRRDKKIKRFGLGRASEFYKLADIDSKEWLIVFRFKAFKDAGVLIGMQNNQASYLRKYVHQPSNANHSSCEQ